MLLPRIAGFYLLAIYASAQNVTVQSVGGPPEFSLGATDVYTAFGLPAVEDGPSSRLANVISAVQVGVRAQAMHMNSHSAIDAWNMAETTVSQIDQWQSQLAGQPVTFQGTNASVLNLVLRDPSLTSINIASPTLTIDQPISIARNNIIVDLGSTQLVPTTAVPYLIRIEYATGVVVQNGQFLTGNSAILVNSSNQVIVRNTHIQGLTGHGIVVTDSSHVLISGNSISSVSGAGVLFHHGANASVARDNQIQDGQNPSNFTAGIVLSDREADLVSNPGALLGPDGYWAVVQPIKGRLNPPHDNVIFSNRITNNLSSGIYSDGSARNVIVHNYIDGNSKEGLCLDYGSTANVVAGNTVRQNGKRWGESDLVMAQDSITDGGRLADGTPAEKVPGISIDNAMYNVVTSNDVERNYGGGIKIVRTGYFNVIGLNTLYSNNLGEGPVFHFFGIELGSTPGSPSPEIDYAPSSGNIVFSNSIRGPHYSGIFFDHGSQFNSILDNVIKEAEHWALESIDTMPNVSQHNLTNQQSRNITAG